jgi:hypothetical protein
MKSCPFHKIEIPDDREVVLTDGKEYPWKSNPKGYFLVKLDAGMICCGFVGADHRMAVEFRGNDPDKMIKEIASRNLCSLGNMGYIASELMIAKYALDNGKEYVQR